MKYTEGYLLDKRYSLKRFIGNGSFGEVWVASDTQTNIDVAAKIYVAMDEQGLEDFTKEFQLTFEINHTNLLHAYYLGVNPEDSRPYLIMPYCPDGSVSKRAGNMTESELWHFLHDVAAGLAYLHAQQEPIIHQDIKPDNILILKSGEYVITDFGISKQLRKTLSKSATQTNTAGAISYMGPERFGKKFRAVKASDIWSLGAALYELASGDVPFCGMGGSLQKQGAEIPDLPEEFSERLNMVCAACMALETWDRPTAAQLRDYCSQVINGQPAEVTWGSNVQKNEDAPAVQSTVVIASAPEEPVKAQLQSATVRIAEDEPVAAERRAETVPLGTVEAGPNTETIPFGTVAASTPEDNIDAPAKSGFVKTKDIAKRKFPVLPAAVIAAVIIAAAVVIGLLTKGGSGPETPSAPIEQAAPATDIVEPEDPGLTIDLAGLTVEDAQGSGFKVSGFSVPGAEGGRIEYRLYDQNGNHLQSAVGEPGAPVSFVVPSNAGYIIDALDLETGLAAGEKTFQLARKLTRAKIESALNEKDNFDSVEREVTSLCASGYRVNCAGYSNAKTISAVNNLFITVPELADKKAVVRNIRYNSAGKVTSIDVAMK